MAITTPRVLSPETIDALIDEWIVPDPYKPGRHNAVFHGGRTHLWAVLAHLRDDLGNLVDVAKSYGLPEEALYAALAYRDRHRTLFNADELLRDEEWNN
jgi:hypothetical protein